jgi:TusA-related sulfurtransferase
MIAASIPKETDLAQLTWPFYLLELKSVLEHMEPGHVLQARVADAASLANIQLVMNASQDKVTEVQRTGLGYVLTIVKG